MVVSDTAKGDRVVDSAAIAETEEAQTYYDRRYQRGYMTSHPDFKVRRIAESLSAMDLPQRGVALDHGCGKHSSPGKEGPRCCEY